MYYNMHHLPHLPRRIAHVCINFVSTQNFTCHIIGLILLCVGAQLRVGRERARPHNIYICGGTRTHNEKVALEIWLLLCCPRCKIQKIAHGAP